MTNDNLHLLVNFRSEVSPPDEATARRIYRLATTGRLHERGSFAPHSPHLPLRLPRLARPRHLIALSTAAAAALSLAGLLVACVAQAAIDYDEGVTHDPPPDRQIEENFWRAIRYGMDGRMIDLERAEEFPAAALPDRLLAWTAPARVALGIDPALPPRNGAQRQRAALDGGGSIEDVYAAEVAESRRTYAAEEVRT